MASEQGFVELETSYQSLAALSDVLSPVRKQHPSRRPGFGIKQTTEQRRTGVDPQENIANYDDITRQSKLNIKSKLHMSQPPVSEIEAAEQSIEETAANLSFSALQAALTDLSGGEAQQFLPLEPHEEIDDIHPTHHYFQSEIDLSHLKSAKDHFALLKEKALANQTDQSLPQFPDRSELQEFSDSQTDFDQTKKSSKSDPILSVSEYPLKDSGHSSIRSSAGSAFVSLTHQSVTTQGNDEISSYKQSLEQYPVEPSLVQYCGETLAESRTSSVSSRHSHGSLTQYSLETTESHHQSGVKSNTRLTELDPSLSQYPFDSTTRLSRESSSSRETKSGHSGDNLFMLDSKDSRPGTVISRSQGGNLSDHSHYKESISERQLKNGISPKQGKEDHHEVDFNFDQSIKSSHNTQRQTLGESIFIPGRQPVYSSTPHNAQNQMSKKQSVPQSDVLGFVLQPKMAEEIIDFDTESDQNIDKFMEKAGVEDYMPANTRKSLLNDGAASEQNLTESDLPLDIMDGQGDSRLPVVPKSPNWRELIPDTPHGQSQSGDPTGEHFQHFSLGDNSNSKTDPNEDRLSGISQHSGRSTSSSHSSARPGLARERTNYDLYPRDSGAEEKSGTASTQREVAPRTHKSSVGSVESQDTKKSVDTLLGGYEGRDAVSLASGGSKDYLQTTIVSDEEHLSKRGSLGRSDSGEDRRASSDRASVGSTDMAKTGPSSYKDEKWGTKVSGMLEGISRRQNLSARVATILAGTPPRPSKANEPVSRIPVKTSSAASTPKYSAPNTPIDPALTRERKTEADNAEKEKESHDTLLVHNDEEDLQNTLKNDTLKSDTLKSDTLKSDTLKSDTLKSDTLKSGRSSEVSEDEDVERLTQEYKAVLQGVSNSVGLDKEIVEMKAKLEEIQAEDQNAEPDSPTLQDKIASKYQFDPHIIDSGEETEDSLDRDVKRILSKYGRNVANFGGENAPLPSENRRSPAGSAYDTDDTLAGRVQGLLKARHVGNLDNMDTPVKKQLSKSSEAADGDVSGLNSTGKSDGESFHAGLGSLKGRLQDVLSDGADSPAKDTSASQSYTHDPLNDRVRRILADTTHLESAATTSKRLSSNASPSSSIDYHNLEKDLDEIQCNLESLKGDQSGRQSNVSEQSAELLKYVQGREEDETLRKARTLLGEDDSGDQSTCSSRAEPEGQGQFSAPFQGRMPLSPLLTSGLVPMNIALDMIHGSTEDSNYSRHNSALYGTTDRTADTDTLLQQSTAKYNAMFTQGVRGLSQDALLATSASDSLVDREVMEINVGVRTDSRSKYVPDTERVSTTSITERVTKLVAQKSYDSYEHPSSNTQKTPNSDLTSKSGSGNARDASPAPNDFSLNLSSISPLTKKPFTAFGNVHNLFANQMSKVSAARFDTSVDAFSPQKSQQLEENHGSQVKREYGALSPTSRARMGESSRLSPRGLQRSTSPTEQRMAQDLRRSSMCTSGSPVSQSHGSSPRDGASSRTSSGARNLRPYKPPGSKMMYYVESGGDGECNTSVAGYSETTVESTHPGSDDAVGPALPASAYGSRRDAGQGHETGVYNNKDLGTIQEQSMDENDPHRNSLRSSSKPSKTSSSHPSLQRAKEEGLVGAPATNQRSSSSADTPTAPVTSNQRSYDRSATPTESRYRYTEERERSFSKTQDWLNGNWPSKEDLACVSPEKAAVHRREQGESGASATRDVTVKTKATERLLGEELGQSGSGKVVSNVDRRTPSQLYSAETSSKLPPKASSQTPSEGSVSDVTSSQGKQRPARAMYNDYSDKCQQLQSKYRNLKDRAEEAISTLITGSMEPLKSDTQVDVRDTLRTAQRYSGGNGRTASLEFGTPKRLGSSRLSMELSLNDTAASRRSHQQLELNDTGAQSLNSTAKSDVTSRSSGSSHDFLKYHTPQAGSNLAASHRGPEYWSSKIASNYDDLAQPAGSRLSQEGEDGLMERMREEREARLVVARHSARAGNDERFHLLQPDEDDEEPRERSPHATIRSSFEPTRSPFASSTSVNSRPKSPSGRPDSAAREIAELKDEGTEKKGESLPEPQGRAKSPYERAKSPQLRARSRLEAAGDAVKKSAEYEPLLGEDIVDFARKRAGKANSYPSRSNRDVMENSRSHSPRTLKSEEAVSRTRPSEIFLRNLEMDRQSTGESGQNSHQRFVNDETPRNSTKSHKHGPKPSKNDHSQDVQEVWERFSASMQQEKSVNSRTGNETASTTGRAPALSIDLEQLTSLLNNPTQHILRQSQEGTIFQQSPNDSLNRYGIRKDKESQNKDLERGARSVENDLVEVRRVLKQNPAIQTHQSASHMQKQSDDQSRDQQEATQGERKSRDTKKSTRGHNIHRNTRDTRDDGEETDEEGKRRRRTNKTKHVSDVALEESSEDEPKEENLTQSADNTSEVDNAQKRKMAWVIKDEELLSIPEDNTLDSVSSDFTTSSEIDSDGKLVTKTTKRHLPNDPKLLKLQQKIAKQKEKYKREQIMAQRRHNKIVQLEQLEDKLEQQVNSTLGYDDESASPQPHTTVDSLGTVTSKTTSTPSPSRRRSDTRRSVNDSTQHDQSTTLGVSDITSTSTLTHGTIDGMTFEQSPVGAKEADYSSSEHSSGVCVCCHKKRAKSAENSRIEDNRGSRSPPLKVSRSQSPPRSPQKRQLAQTYPSPTSTRRKKEKKIQEPTGMMLREVDYDRSLSPNKAHQSMATSTLPEPPQKSSQRPKSVYMEIDPPQAVPKTKTRGSNSRHRQKSSERREGKSPRRHGDSLKVRYEDEEERKGRSREQKQSRSKNAYDQIDESVQMTPKVTTREFGQMCPTPMVPSPPVERTVRKVTMVSESVQTDSGVEKSSKKSKQEMRSRKAHQEKRNRSPGMFTPETSENEDPEAAAQREWHVDRHGETPPRRHQPHTLTAKQAGVTWFVDMKESKPWKQPLAERHANAAGLETWPQMDPHSRRALEDLAFRKTDSLGRVPSDYFPHHVPEDEEEEKKLTGLQRAFDKRMQVFISKSRERQRLNKMRAQERDLNAVHGRDRDVIFKVDRPRVPNVDAHPLSDLHFQPKRRVISKSEMKEMSALKYKKLPEVLRACEEKKRQEFYQTNRLRARIYKQRILNGVLKKKAPQLKA